MKKISIVFCLVALMLLSTFCISSSAVGTAVFKTTQFETTQNETFKTTVYLEENSNLIDFQIQLTYDTTVVDLVSISENENMRGTMEITEKSEGIIHISYTKTSANLTEKSDLFDLEFTVDDTVGPGSYDFLKVDSSYDNQAHTMVGSNLEDLPIMMSFDTLKIYKSGDVNLDNAVSIADVTYLRQHLASIRTLSDYQLKFADAYFDNNISISDAVRIQQNLADDEILLGNRVNVTFYDKDGDILVVKSVKYGSSLSKLPTPSAYRGFTWLYWATEAGGSSEPDLTNITNNMSVYAVYQQDASEAITWYKEKLSQIYYTTNVLNSDLFLCADMTYQNGYNATIQWNSQTPNIINASTGEFFKPIYDSEAILTATIISYKDGSIEAEDSITFKYDVSGEFQCPSKEEIKEYLGSIFGEEINANLALPKKITNEDVENESQKYEVRVNWSILGDDNTENGISQIARSAYEQNVTLVANVTFNGKPIDGDGKIYFDDLILKPITEKEVSDYIIDQIASNMGLSMTNGEFLWNNDEKYNASVRWISKNTRIATVENNQVSIKSTAINGEALPLVAEVTYPTGDGAVTFELSYTVSVVADNKLLVPGTNIDEDLYDALKTATGVYGNLTTDALRDVKFVYLDLSGYPEIKDLSGLTYCSNLRVLNISGLRIEKGLNEIASLSKLESLIARDCGFDDSSLTDGGIPILKNMIYLKMLDLSYNNFTTLNSVFGEDRRYGRLQELYLGHNQLTDISAISNAPLLQFLLLEDNQLESADLENFHKFKVLKLLSLANNNINSISNLKNNKTLLELRLQGNNISSVKDLRYMTYLESLYIGDNALENVYAGGVEGNVSYLKYLTELKILYLNDNNIEDISDLLTLTKLQAVNVSNNNIQSLSILAKSSDTLVELYAENNDLQSLSFISNLPKLKKLMIAGNSSTYEGTLPTYLGLLTELETLTISGKDLRTLSFLENMPKLTRLDVANCNLSEASDINALANLNSTLRYLDISNNNFEDIAPLQQLSNLIVFYADNVKGTVDAGELFALMSEIKYVSMENCGITDLGWLSKFRNLVYVNFAGNNLSSFDLANYISERSTGTLEYLYIDSRTPFAFVNSYVGFDDSVLKELSMENVHLDAVDYLPDMQNLEYLNISNSSVTDLRGSHPDMYDQFSIGRIDTPDGPFYRFEKLKTVDVTGVQADISVLDELPNIEKVYAVGIPSEMAFYESSISTLYSLYNKGVECYLYDYDTPYESVASVEGEKILGEIADISCDITVAANNLISDNNPFLQDTVNDFDITWSLSNNTNYAITDNHITVQDYTNIADEELIVTAEISVYPDQAPVTREFVINTKILRVDTPYLNIDSTGAGDYLARGAEFTYDVQTKATTTDGFSTEAAPVYDNIEYSYSATLQSGDVTTVDTILLTENAPQYQINPETDSLESTVTITATIGHNEISGYVVDKVITKNILIKTRTFDMTYVSNGGLVTSTSDGASVTVRTYYEDAPLFEDISVAREGYTFDGWYADEGLTKKFENTIMPQEHTTIYAKWNINSYTVSFVSNEGSAVESMTVDYNAVVPKPDDPTRPVHLFQGWFKDEALTQTWNFETDVIKGDTTLYAKWLLNEYTVTFNANGGSSTTSTKYVYGSTLEPPTVTRNYYTFKGWYKDSSCTTAWNLSSDTVTQDVTVYAKWEQNPVVGWVKASALPSGAEVVDRYYSYNKTHYTENTATSLSGWTRYDSYWVWSSNGSKAYSPYFPSTYYTGDWYYQNLAKSQPYYAYETETNRRDVSTSWGGYIYWHWAPQWAYYNNTGRKISPYADGSWSSFYSFESTTAYPSAGTGYSNNSGIENFNCAANFYGCEGGVYGALYCPRFFRFDFYWCNYSDYYKMFKYTKTTDETSTSYPSGSNLSNIQEWVKYRNK